MKADIGICCSLWKGKDFQADIVIGVKIVLAYANHWRGRIGDIELMEVILTDVVVVGNCLADAIVIGVEVVVADG